MMKRRIWRSIGYASTLFLFICDVTPSTFHIPVNRCPWLFLFSIAWFLMINSGFFKIMIRQLRPALCIFGLLTFMTGVLYPLLVTGIAQVVFPYQANGSLIEMNRVIRGSRLIGQTFTGAQYFWGRPSATPGLPYTAFDPLNLTGSSGSNLGPLSPTLFESLQQQVAELQALDPDNPLLIPVDLLTASASGLDPHISLEATYYQVPRVARARGWSEQELIELVNLHLETRQFGFLGDPRVNVLLLNIALDGLQ